jgi:hypothetical protein
MAMISFEQISHLTEKKANKRAQKKWALFVSNSLLKNRSSKVLQTF